MCRLPTPLPGLLLAAGLLAGGCTADRTLRIAVNHLPAESLSPELFDLDARRISMHLFESLLAVDAAGQVVPHLATAWSYDTTRTELTLALRRGVRLHDGSPLTAEVVAACLRRRPADESTLRSLARLPLEVEVRDPHTVVLRLPAPHAPLLRLLTSRLEAPIYRSIDRPGGGRRHLGTGPYRFERISRDGRHLYLRKFDDYWGEPGLADRLRFTAYDNSDLALAAIEAGREDLTHQLSVTALSRVAHSPRLALVTGGYNTFVTLGMNNQRPPFNDPGARRNLARAVDVPELVLELYEGAAEPTGRFIGRGLYPVVAPPPDGVPAAWGRPAGAPVDARFEAPLRLLFPPAASPRKRMRFAGLVQAMLEPLGYRVEGIYTEDWEAFEELHLSGQWHLSLDGLSTSSGDLYEFLDVLYLRDHPQGGGGLFGMERGELASLLERARSSLSEQEQMRYYRRLIARIAEQTPCLPLADLAVFLARSHEVDDFYPGPYSDWTYAQVAKVNW